MLEHHIERLSTALCSLHNSWTSFLTNLLTLLEEALVARKTMRTITGCYEDLVPRCVHHGILLRISYHLRARICDDHETWMQSSMSSDNNWMNESFQPLTICLATLNDPCHVFDLCDSNRLSTAFNYSWKWKFPLIHAIMPANTKGKKTRKYFTVDHRRTSQIFA